MSTQLGTGESLERVGGRFPQAYLVKHAPVRKRTVVYKHGLAYSLATFAQDVENRASYRFGKDFPKRVERRQTAAISMMRHAAWTIMKFGPEKPATWVEISDYAGVDHSSVWYGVGQTAYRWVRGDERLLPLNLVVDDLKSVGWALADIWCRLYDHDMSLEAHAGNLRAIRKITGKTGETQSAAIAVLTTNWQTTRQIADRMAAAGMAREQGSVSKALKRLRERGEIEQGFPENWRGCGWRLKEKAR